MKRRQAIRDLIIVAGVFTLAPSCVNEPGKASIALKHISINAAQENLLRDMASAIIPATDTPGAGQLGCHLFTLKMLDDCYEKDMQQQFIRGLNDLNAYAKKYSGNSFVQCTEPQQQALLRDIEDKKTGSIDLVVFYNIMKERTIQGYLSSEYVLTNINKYEFIPSVKYNGYAPVTL